MSLVNSQPLSLFDITLNFISSNVEYIESLVEFPEMIGKKIFDDFMFHETQSIQDGVLLFKNLSELTLSKILKIFALAYGNIVLRSLNFSYSLIVINEHFNSVISLLPSLVELCLCYCSLGNNHELFEHIPEMLCLKKLCLKQNGLKSTVIRKISIPFRMFGKGPKNLECIDLSDNPLMDEIVPWLVVFKKLRWINLSNTCITDKGITLFIKNGFSKYSSLKEVIHPVVTEGWASRIIESWKIQHEQRLKSRGLVRGFRPLLGEKKYSNCGHLVLFSPNASDHKM